MNRKVGRWTWLHILLGKLPYIREGLELVFQIMTPEQRQEFRVRRFGA